MRTRTRVLCVAAVCAAGPLAAAQTPAVLPPTLPVQAPAVKPADPVPMVPQQMPKPAVKEGQTAPTPPATPPVLPLTPPTGAPVPSCPGCGDSTPAAPAPEEQKGRIVPAHKGIREAAWMNVGFGLTWLKPQPMPFPILQTFNGNTATSTLLGETNLGTKHHDGIRVDGGTWTNDCHTVGFGFGGLLVEHRSRFVTVGSDAFPNTTLARPFTDAVRGVPNQLIVAGPGVATGTMAIATTSRLSGLEGNFRRNLKYTESVSVDFLIGARYLDLDESLTVYQSTTPQTTTPQITVPVGRRDMAGNVIAPLQVGPGQTIDIVDRAYTRNQFYGGEAGLRMEYKHGIWFLAATPRIGFGSVHQTTYIDGNTNVAGVLEQPTSGGLLAVGLPTTGYSGPDTDGNIGRNVSNRFAVLTEVGLSLGVQLTQSARLSVGYNFLYLSSTARPANQFDTTINPRLVPTSSNFGTLSGPSNPRLTFDREDFYAHGVTLTLGLQY
jgi:hypothetical protein